MKEVKFKKIFWFGGYKKCLEVEGYAFYWLGNLWVVFLDCRDSKWFVADYETGYVISGFVSSDKDSVVKDFKDKTLKWFRECDLNYKEVIEAKIENGYAKRLNSYSKEFFEELKSLCEPEGLIS